MDYQTKFLYNQQGEIYAIQPLTDAGGITFEDRARIEIVATGASVVDAMGVVRQLNFRKKLSEEAEARLLQSHRTNEKLRREIKKLKAGGK